VKVQGREYRIRSETGVESVRKAAQLLDETIEKVRERVTTVDTVDVAVMAGLNVANSLLSERAGAVVDAQTARRMSALIERLQAAMDDAAPEPR
jgi:cell division protein ZapA (FtsZ GTPase activity inhibitor)